MSADQLLVSRTPVIIDTDPGVDDVLALLLALASPEIEILAIIVSFGNTDIDASYLNVFRVYRALSRHLKQFPEEKARFPNFNPDDPSKRPLLVRGSSVPLEGEVHSAQYFHGRDGLADMTLRHPECDEGTDLAAEGLRYFQETKESVAEVVVGVLRERPARSVTYIALGPLTSLAQVLRFDASTVRENIGRVVCMGGALDVPGNTSPVAEFNWFADPYAVRELLISPDAKSGLPLERFVLLPLDVTTPHELPFPIYKTRVDTAFESTAQPSQAEGKAPLIHFTSSFLERTREVMCEFGKDAMELHDLVAVWCAIENPNSVEDPTGDRFGEGWRAVRRRFDIERTGELTRGMVVIDRREDEGAYAPGANRAHVQAELEASAFRPAGEWESSAVPAQVEVEDDAQAAKGRQSSHGPGHMLVTPTSASDKGDKCGVYCVTQTPGKRAMLQVLLQRIWGVEL